MKINRGQSLKITLNYEMAFDGFLRNFERGEAKILKEYMKYISRNFCKAAAKITQKGAKFAFRNSR